MSDVINQEIPKPEGLNEQKLAEHIIEQAKANGIRAEVKVNQIPPHIAANILIFLQRVKSEGMEALAWVEAYTFMQQHAPQQQQQQQQQPPPPQQPQGVPFGGLPVKKA